MTSRSFAVILAKGMAMNDFKFNCPHCQQSLEAPSDMIGYEITCPSCNNRILIPSPQPQPAPPKKKFVLRKLQPASLPQSTISQSQPTRPCPFCAETILAAAIKCKHCGSTVIGNDGHPAVPSVPATPKNVTQPANKKVSLIGFLVFIAVFCILVVLLHWGCNSTSTSTAPEVRMMPFDQSKLGNLTVTEDSLFDEGLSMGQFYQANLRINGIEPRTSPREKEMVEEKLHWIQNMSGEDPSVASYNMKPFVEGFRKGYYGPIPSKEELERQNNDLRLQVEEKKRRDLADTSYAVHSEEAVERYVEKDSGFSYIPPKGWQRENKKERGFVCTWRGAETGESVYMEVLAKTESSLESAASLTEKSTRNDIVENGFTVEKVDKAAFSSTKGAAGFRFAVHMAKEQKWNTIISVYIIDIDDKKRLYATWVMPSAEWQRMEQAIDACMRSVEFNPNRN